jgi:hypothetical protein
MHPTLDLTEWAKQVQDRGGMFIQADGVILGTQ